MTDIASLRTDAEKARLEMNALKNGAARGVYALDKVGHRCVSEADVQPA